MSWIDDKDAEIEYLRNRVSAAEDELDQLRARLEGEGEWVPPANDESRYVSFEYGKLQIAEDVIKNKVSPDTLALAAKMAAARAETIKTIYIEGAMLGIDAMQEALLDIIGSAKRGKR